MQMRLVFFIIISCISVLVGAQSPKLALYKLPSEGMSELKTRLFTDMESVKPNETFKVGVHFDLQRGWYTYTQEENDKNLPTVVNLKLPKGFKVLKEEWPSPSEVPGRKGGMDKVYKRDFYVVYHIKAPKKKGMQTITADLEWQVCDPSICKIGEANLETQITVGDSKKNDLHPLINK
jgi:thiol:disulfide interchange protein DsbD